MKSIARLILAITTIAATLTSCSDTPGLDSKNLMLVDIVTVASADESSGMTFTFVPYDDAPEVALYAPDYLTNSVEPGTRVMLYYCPESNQPYVSGRVKVRKMQAINNGELQAVDPYQYNWAANPVWLNSVWRSGNYLNLRFRASYSAEPRDFCLIVDESKIDRAVPDVYLVHDLKGQPESYLRDAVASFDISSVWTLPTCIGINVHINDSNLKREVYTFMKQ